MKNYLILFLFICLVAVACSKENSDLFVLYPGNPANDTTWSSSLSANSSANTLFDALAFSPFVDSFSVTGSALFHVSASLDVAIPASCITNANGSPVTPGKVRVEIRHVIRRGDFIRYARPTTTYGKLMESGSVFEIKFFRKDQELALQTDKKLILTLKDPDPVNNMSVFFGTVSPQPPFPVGTNPFFAWATSIDSSFVTTFVHHDSTGTTKGYQLFVGKTNWINCQVPFDNAQPKTNITFTLPPNFTNKNTAVFAVVKQRKIIVQLNGDVASRSFFAPNIPVGTAIQMLTLSLIGNQYYLGFKEANVSQDFIGIINPTSKSMAEISRFLSGL